MVVVGREGGKNGCFCLGVRRREVMVLVVVGREGGKNGSFKRAE